MLLLDRKPDEEVTLVLANGQIMTVKIISLTNKSARIGIDAPKDIQIFRHEVYLEKLEDGSLKIG